MASSTPTGSLKTGNGAFGTNFTAFGGRLNDISSLDITNGMTAGYGDNDGHVDNPPAWPGTYGGNPKTQPVRIGVLRNLSGSLGVGKLQVYSLYFIFNPNQIVASFMTTPGQIPPAYLYSATSAGDIANASTGAGTAPAVTAPNLTNGQTISWSLIFDRTYDMIYDPNPDENRGVLRDVAALYNLMGTFQNQGGVPVSTPVQVVFAQTSSGQLWGFTGFISSVNITYGIFRHNMIPSRAEVDIQMTTTYISGQSPPADGSTPATSPNTVFGAPPGLPAAPSAASAVSAGAAAVQAVVSGLGI